MSVPNQALDEDPMVQRARRRAIATEFLVISRDQLENAKRGRARAAATAHNHGIAWREIGEVLGVSESTARTLGTDGEARD